MTRYASGVDGMGYTAQGEPGFLRGRLLRFLGQPGALAAGNVVNQGIGTITIPAISAGATDTVTISDTLIRSGSRIFVQVRQGTTTPAAGALGALVCTCRAPTFPTGSCIVDVRNVGTDATLGTDYQLHYWVVGP